MRAKNTKGSVSSNGGTAENFVPIRMEEVQKENTKVTFNFFTGKGSVSSNGGIATKSVAIRKEEAQKEKHNNSVQFLHRKYSKKIL